MTCTTIDRHCDTARHSIGCAATSEARRNGRLVKLISGIGEQLFHYRYVRAELIERALERGTRNRRRGS